ncbi:hypothetical protein PG988_006741 [Apiospora saccharicola]
MVNDETRKMVSMQELLDSRIMTDVKVSCGNRTWDLHKLILCSRCPFFKKAFTGNFQEAKTGQVILRENDPDDIDGVIQYIYTGEVSKKLLKEGNAEAYVNMFKLGDFFDLPGLRQNALLLLRVNVMNYLLESAGLHYIKRDQRESSDDGFLNEPEKCFGGFRHLVLTAYGDGTGSPNAGLVATYEPLRELVRDFMHDTFMVAAKTPKFRELCREAPALGADLFACMADPDHKLSRNLLANPPTTCNKCGRHMFRFNRGKVVRMGNTDKREMAGTAYGIRVHHPSSLSIQPDPGNMEKTEAWNSFEWYLESGIGADVEVSCVDRLLKNNSAEAYTTMFELGDFFDLPGLREESLKLLDATVKQIAISVDEVVYDATGALQVPAQQISAFRHIVEFAYANRLQTYQPMRLVVLKFLKYTYMMAFKLEPFKNILGDHPTLAVDIVFAMVQNDGDGPLGNRLHLDPPLSAASAIRSSAPTTAVLLNKLDILRGMLIHASARSAISVPGFHIATGIWKSNPKFLTYA